MCARLETSRLRARCGARTAAAFSKIDIFCNAAFIGTVKRNAETVRFVLEISFGKKLTNRNRQPVRFVHRRGFGLFGLLFPLCGVNASGTLHACCPKPPIRIILLL